MQRSKQQTLINRLINWSIVKAIKAIEAFDNIYLYDIYNC